MHDEIVLEFALLAVVNQIDPRVNLCESHLTVCFNSGTPMLGVAAGEIIRAARQHLFAVSEGRGIAPGDHHLDWHTAERKRSLRGAQRESETMPSRDERGAGRSLSTVSLELKRELAEIRSGQKSEQRE